jgi:hypothetical protein
LDLSDVSISCVRSLICGPCVSSFPVKYASQIGVSAWFLCSGIVRLLIKENEK